MGALKNRRHELFAHGLAKGEAAREAYVAAGFSASTEGAIDVGASRLAARKDVQARVQELLAVAAEKAEITAAKVMGRLWAIATADPNELIEYRRGCCRYCYGKGFRYQETPGEQARRRAQWERDREAAAGKPEEAKFTRFDEMGGVGFDPRKPPRTDCPECFGEGMGEARMKDTRELSDQARALYAGVRVTRDGFQVQMQDQQGALIKVGEQLGMFVRREIRATVELEDLLEQLDGSGEAGPPS